MLLIREAADCQRKRKYNIWKHVIDAHYILCYSIIELSFMHSTLCRRSLVLAKYREQSFETIDLRNIERHQKPGMDFWCLFLLSKIPEPRQREQIQWKGVTG